MTPYLTLTPGLTTTVLTGGHAVQVANSGMGDNGGLIANPLAARDQNLFTAESIFVNITGREAGLKQTAFDLEIIPGQTYIVPSNVNVSVNAATSGHRFTAFFLSPYEIQYPPTYVPGQPGSGAPGPFGGPEFPPESVTGLTTVIPSYLYQQYTDDDDLWGFIDAQNKMQQDYVDTFNALNLPIYPGPVVQGKLLDWVGQGVYGMARPMIGYGIPLQVGPLNTWGPDMPAHSMDTLNEYFKDPYRNTVLSINELGQLSVGPMVITTDDIYRRILSWHFFKGDGNYFSVRWLKRRIWRFCYGFNGISPDFAVDPSTGLPHGPEHGHFADPDDKFISNIDQVSITLGVNRNMTIRFVLGNRTVRGGFMLNTCGCNGFGPFLGGPDPDYIDIQLNDLESTYVPLPPMPFMDIFKESVDTGALELPYQFNYRVNIG